MNGGNSEWKDNLAASEDHSAGSADLADREDSAQAHQKCTRQYVQNASKIAKCPLNQQKEGLFFARHASEKSVKVKATDSEGMKAATNTEKQPN